jgi:repressor LexA
MSKLTAVLGLTSTGGVFKVLGRLTDAGYLERVDGRIGPTTRFFERPVLDSVRGERSQSPDQSRLDDRMSVEDYLVERPERTSYCRVQGDSMKDVGLLDGDVVVVETKTLPRPGDIVVAVVDDHATVKYLRMDAAGAWFLEPANPAYEPIRPTGPLEVLGVVTGSFRRYRGDLSHLAL